MTDWIPDDVPMSLRRSRPSAEFSGPADASGEVQITVGEAHDDLVVEADISAIHGMFAARLEPVGGDSFRLTLRVRERADDEIDCMARALEFVAQQMRKARNTYQG